MNLWTLAIVLIWNCLLGVVVWGLWMSRATSEEWMVYLVVYGMISCPAAFFLWIFGFGELFALIAVESFFLSVLSSIFFDDKFDGRI